MSSQSGVSDDAEARMLRHDHVVTGRELRHEGQPARAAAGVQEQQADGPVPARIIAMLQPRTASLVTAGSLIQAAIYAPCSFSRSPLSSALPWLDG